jgi:hydroxymethylbilane synthase
MVDKNIKMPIRIGTRGSRLAMIQTRMVVDRLQSVYPQLREDGNIQIVKVKTTGDKIRDRKLSKFGGKGMFLKEIEAAILRDEIDIGVHSAKDVPSNMPSGFALAAYLPREDARDAFFGHTVDDFTKLSPTATIGTSSPRREAFAKHHYPDCSVVVYRGNVDTRFDNLRIGQVDGTFLAVAGLKRIGRSVDETAILDPSVMLPGGGQGAITLEIRDTRDDLFDLLNPVNCPLTNACVTAERSYLKVIDGDCKSPLSAYAVPIQSGDDVNGHMYDHRFTSIDDLVSIVGPEKLTHLYLRVAAARPDGTHIHKLSGVAKLRDGNRLGRKLGHQMRDELPDDFFDWPLP